MGRKASKQDLPTSAPLYIIGPRTVEWSYDMVNFHSVTMKNSESFGEYASKCHAKFKPS